ncbi:MAG: aminoacyl-tRNA hydrolase [Planctomycetes bacterium RBG_16_41_13]|nr:MAG: aminoacyl-tRNA hydrolase [Planctomycetes bacterium RBG_16_41_13]
MKMIVGLGNPGEKYLRTRHNLGFMVIDEFSQKLGMGGFQHKFQSLFCKKEVEHEEIILLKPQTFMNLSGIAVQEVANMYKCQTRDIMVICDDLDLPFGKLRIRRAGGCGGHRGLESVAASLGTADFPRLRIGIGRPKFNDTSRFVLSMFSSEEDVEIAKSLEEACKALKTWVYNGIESCMNEYN